MANLAINDLPWDDISTGPACKDPMGRATELAIAASNRFAMSADEQAAGLARFRAERQAEADGIMAAARQRHVLHIETLKAEAAARKAERVAAHNARNAAARQAALQKKAA